MTAGTINTSVSESVNALEEYGAVRLPPLVSDAMLRDMQTAFAARLRWLRFNNVDGYERGDRMRLMVPDVLTLSEGFVQAALHPLVTAVVNEYCGPNYELCEAKGWQTQPTNRDFHGWHGDAWYDQTQLTDTIPREVKLAIYLTDVKTGAFQYLRGTHRQFAPRLLHRPDLAGLPMDEVINFDGPAGTAVLFDTSGIHRQGIPILEPRQAVFLNYHDPNVPLQQEDVDYYRYHPLLLNAAFLGDLSTEQMRILGFGNKANYQPGYVRKPSHPRFHALVTGMHAALLHGDYWWHRIGGKLSRLLRGRG